MLAAILLVSTMHLDKHALHERHIAHLERLHEEHLEHLARERELRVGNTHVTASVQPSEPRTDPSGQLGCAGLESLWRSAGGSYSAEFVAAEIAIAESGGNQYATGPVGERGYWQINPDHGSLSTYDPYGNARAAIIISDDGVNWSPWTTYTSGAYIGRCLWRLAQLQLLALIGSRY